jgi:hypothetical protein
MAESVGALSRRLGTCACKRGKMKHDFSHIDRRFDIDECTSDPPPQPNNAQQAAPEYGKVFDPRRLAAVSAGGGWWNPTTQELVPILDEDDPNYRQNEAIITEAIKRWDRGTRK